MTLVDSNVLLDIFTRDPKWYAWSAAALMSAGDEGALATNPIIFAEVSIHFASLEELEEALPAASFHRAALPWEAAFLAGRCFAQYRKRGGARRSPMPDFYIGAHAAVAGMGLLTRDPKRYRSHFPKLRLICPEPG
ncbi:MAG: type II toxin-antitoxin system VapC family toxin [Myxococcales bacterium]|nr:type II toxin-antitoxin system VapC family toxin [Myxococcales bacterium]